MAHAPLQEIVVFVSLRFGTTVEQTLPNWQEVSGAVSHSSE